MKFLQRLWNTLKGIGSALLPAIFSIIVLIGGFLVLTVIPQGKDIVLALADPGLFPQQIFFTLAAVLWAVQIWAWARLVYILRERKLRLCTDYPEWATTIMPKCLGVLAFLVIAYALFAMQAAADNHILLWMGIGFIILALIFLFFIHFATREVYLIKSGERKNGLYLFSDLPPGIRKFFMILTLAALFPLTLFIINPQVFTFEGGAAVAVLCISFWVPLGSWVLYLSYRSRLPLFLILILLTVIFSFFNDNHHVRVLDQKPQRVSLSAQLDKFLSKYPAAEKTGAAEPFYLVATEGGGIRSAYWTALVLARIQDVKDPAFSDRLFCISSVSGGSLGAAVFAALVLERQLGRSTSLFDDSRNILKEDFLSPTIAVMLTGDLLQQLIPFPIYHLSRGLALERSWEIAWKKTVNNDRFSGAVTDLWRQNSDSHVPSLFLNCTLVETGQRTIASNLMFAGSFVNTLDIYHYTEDGSDMPLSTAVMNSARFPYISPAGTLNGGIHVVDGGYFDNSAADTIIEIFFALRKKLLENPKKLQVKVLLLNNHPLPERGINENFSPIEPLCFLPGLLAPIKAFFNVGNAHATFSIDALRKIVRTHGGTFVTFEPYEENVQFPLGWSLSPAVQQKMAEQAKKIVDKKWPRVCLE